MGTFIHCSLYMRAALRPISSSLLSLTNVSAFPASSTLKLSASFSTSSPLQRSTTMSSGFYELAAELPKAGEQLRMSDFEGKVVLIVNVASRCGFTPQYKGLESMYKKYQDRGFAIIGFPCNQFGFQESGSDESIATFCSKNYGVSFPVVKKSNVNGSDANPVYKWLKDQKSGLFGTSFIKWNFEKFLVGRDGKVIDRYGSTTTPGMLESAVEKALEAPAPEKGRMNELDLAVSFYNVMNAVGL